jgi:FkbM family methyltransferase
VEPVVRYCHQVLGGLVPPSKPLAMLRRAASWLITHLPSGVEAQLRDLRQTWRDSRVKLLAHRLAGLRPLNQLVVGARGEPYDYVQYLRRRGLLKLTGIEPEPSEAQRLMASGKWDAILAYALGADTAERTLYVTRVPGCASFLRPHEENLRRFCTSPEWFDVVNQVPVQVRPLSRVLESERLPAPDILQLDVQGLELDVLKGGLSILPRIAVIDLEAHFYPIYHAQPLFWDVHTFLEQQGFYCFLLRREGIFGQFFVEADACYVNWELLHSDPCAQLAVECCRIRHA